MFKLYPSTTAWFTILLVVLCGVGLMTPAAANQAGLNWLTAQAQPEGDYRTPTDLATSFQATTETLRILVQSS